MHMADALVSPAVGISMWAVSAGILGLSSSKLKKDMDDRKVPLMGVLGAFIFAAQMINFSIPGTGSSGHIGGGLILAVLLGPYAAFLVMASVLAIQALFFADGGLLALGCNMINMGFFPAFMVYPVYKRFTGGKKRNRLFVLSIIGAVFALQMGALAVVIETVLSGISELPLRTFLFLMQPIHLVIGAIEGLITAGIIVFMYNARPDILEPVADPDVSSIWSFRKVLIGTAIAASVTAGMLSWFASAYPDGLEWAIFRTSGKEELHSPDGLHTVIEGIQEKTAVLPDYGFKREESQELREQDPLSSWPSVDPGTSVAGLLGGALTLFVTVMIGTVIKLTRRHI